MDDYPDLIVEPAVPRILTIDDLRPANASLAGAAMPRALTASDIEWNIWAAGGDSSQWSGYMPITSTTGAHARRGFFDEEDEIDLAVEMSGFFSDYSPEMAVANEPAAAPHLPHSAPASVGAQNMDSPPGSEVITVGGTWHADGDHPALGGHYQFE